MQDLLETSLWGLTVELIMQFFAESLNILRMLQISQNCRDQNNRCFCRLLVWMSICQVYDTLVHDYVFTILTGFEH